jgi:cell division septum initiation protein DivIVA
MVPEPPLDATGIARRQFATVRKGYDPGEVRGYLHELSDMVGRLQRGEAHEHERAERAENRAQLAEQLDEHRLVELLGEETARVLEAARGAAGDIRSRAEESAARMVREAQVEARAITDRADNEAAARRSEILAEADGLRREAEEEVERRRIEGQVVVDDMRREAEEERERMLSDGERARGEAEAAAEQIRAAARDQGRRLVGEALTVRERMLGDLARRRRTAREQLERLNGARERLLAAYEVVKRTVDEATTELTVALPEAKLASEMAMRRVSDEPEETVEVLEAELSVARMAGLVDDLAAASVTDDELDEMIRELADDEPEGEPGAEPAAEAGARGTETVARSHAEVDTRAEPPPGDAGADAEPVAQRPAARAESDAESVAQRPAAPAPTSAEAVAQAQLDAAAHAETDADTLGDAQSESATGQGSEDDEGEAGPYVDELFARIRAERRPGSGAPGQADGPGGASSSRARGAVAVALRADVADGIPPDQSPPPQVEADRVAETDRVADAVEAEDTEPDDPASVVLRGRDDVLSAVERELGRRLKRVLADEQNEVLDLLRRGRSVAFADVVPASDEHADRFAIAASGDLDTAAGYGAALVGGEKAASCDELAGTLGRTLVEPLRVRIERSFDDCDGDLEEVTERLRALYREWKGHHIGNAVRHYTAAAYAWGAYVAAPEGAELRWLVDRSCEACPDCDDNALAGQVTKGEAFPTGDRCSPAHPDCRCLVVSATVVDGA